MWIEYVVILNNQIQYVSSDQSWDKRCCWVWVSPQAPFPQRIQQRCRWVLMWLQALPHKVVNWQALRRYFETVWMNVDGSSLIHLFPNFPNWLQLQASSLLTNLSKSLVYLTLSGEESSEHILQASTPIIDAVSNILKVSSNTSEQVLHDTRALLHVLT